MDTLYQQSRDCSTILCLVHQTAACVVLWDVCVCVCVYVCVCVCVYVCVCVWSAVGEFRTDPAERGFFLFFTCKYSRFSNIGDAAESGSRDTDDHVSHRCGCEEETCFIQTEYLSPNVVEILKERLKINYISVTY